MNEKLDKGLLFQNPQATGLMLLPEINHYYFEEEVPSLMQLVNSEAETHGNTDYYLIGDFGLSIYENGGYFMVRIGAFRNREFYLG